MVNSHELHFASIWENVSDAVPNNIAVISGNNYYLTTWRMNLISGTGGDSFSADDLDQYHFNWGGHHQNNKLPSWVYIYISRHK